jgi:chemotaxis protein CheD
MLEAMLALGAQRNRIIAKIVGGACMFESSMFDSAMNIGRRNSEAVKEILSEEKIPIIGEDVGNNYGRTMQFDVATGRVLIRSAKIGSKTI